MTGSLATETGLQIFSRAELDRFWAARQPHATVSGVVCLTDPGRRPAGNIDAQRPDVFHLAFRDAYGPEIGDEGLPRRSHIVALLKFLCSHRPLHGPLLIHCEQGLSRSPTAAWLAFCLWWGPGSEEEALQRVRELRPGCNINAWLVTLAQAEMGRFRLFAALRSGSGVQR